MSWALAQQVITDPPARHVLLCLANYAGENGMGAFPAAETLAKHTGLALRTIRLKLSQLEEAGVIVRGNQAIAAAYIERADRRPVVYNLVIKRGESCAPREATGCSSQPNGVNLTTERGAPAAPDTSPIRQGTKAPAPVVPASGLPEWINSATWAAFDAMRRKIRAPMTQHAAELLIAELANFRTAGEDPDAILQKSIKNSWRGVFSLLAKPGDKIGGRPEPANPAHRAKSSEEIRKLYGRKGKAASPEVVAKHLEDLKKRLHMT